MNKQRERRKGRDKQPFAQLFPAPPSPVMKVSGLNSAPVGPERNRSHTPASRSICTLRGTYLATDPELISEKYVSTCPKKKGCFFLLYSKNVEGALRIMDAYARELQRVGAVIRLLGQNGPTRTKRFGKQDRKESDTRTPFWSSPCSARTIFQKFSPIWFPA